MTLTKVNANQAFVLTRVGGTFCLLLTIETTTLGRRVNFLLERSWRNDSLYVYTMPAVPAVVDLPFIRQLGITQLPELRCYEQGRLLERHLGLHEIERFAAHTR